LKTFLAFEPIIIVFDDQNHKQLPSAKTVMF